jgi:23S rRNA (uracil1939-C5)-methyltransferase
MARLEDGSVGFVEGVLPGERVAVEALTKRRGFSEGRLLRVIEASPARAELPCSIADRCGGCDWHHIDYPAQLFQKRELIGEALRRTGGFQSLPAIEVTASKHSLGYRLRIRLHIDEEGRTGFFEKRSHRLIAATDCAVARPELQQALSRFRSIAEQRPRELALFETAELRVSPLAPERALTLLPRGDAGQARRRAAPLLELLHAEFAIALSGQPAEFVQHFPLEDDLLLDVSPHAFVQVNWEVNLALVEHVVSGARGRGVQRFLDVYAGAGNFTLPLARAGLNGISVEGHPEAARCAADSLARYGFEQVKAVAGDATQALNDLARRRERFELVVLDPPRAGAAALIEPLRSLAPRHIAYCSCDPVTLARDLRALCQTDYEIEAIRGFDMFPGTHHVETLVWLRSK